MKECSMITSIQGGTTYAVVVIACYLFHFTQDTGVQPPHSGSVHSNAGLPNRIRCRTFLALKSR